MKMIDHYSLSARVAPMIIVISPFAAAAWGFVGDSVWKSAGVLIGMPIAFAILLSEAGRDFGRRRQLSLWAEWGGRPTTRILRHIDSTINPSTKARYHTRLALLYGQPLPSAEEERLDPVQADKHYESCVDTLQARTRSADEFGLLYRENVSYGFRRNLWGLKNLGLAAVTLSLALIVVAQLWVSNVVGIRLWIAFSYSAALGIVWIVVVSKEWVRTPAEAYAARLLEACERIPERNIT